MTFTIYAAIDLAGGKAVRLWQGERSRSRNVSDDPVALAQSLVEGGARFLHVVDLDAAFSDGDNDAVARRIIAAAGAPVQVGGGVRDAGRFRTFLDAGAARVVIGTLAFAEPDVLSRVVAEDPERVVVAADTRAARVVTTGWTRDSGTALSVAARTMREAGVRRLLVTAVERDGTGRGPDHAVLRQALDAFGPGVIASGGVGSVDDVRALAPLAAAGLDGVVVGSLLVDGRATPSDLLDAAAALGVDEGRATGHRPRATGGREGE